MQTIVHSDLVRLANEVIDELQFNRGFVSILHERRYLEPETVPPYDTGSALTALSKFLDRAGAPEGASLLKAAVSDQRPLAVLVVDLAVALPPAQWGAVSSVSQQVVVGLAAMDAGWRGGRDLWHILDTLTPSELRPRFNEAIHHLSSAHHVRPGR